MNDRMMNWRNLCDLCKKAGFDDPVLTPTGIAGKDWFRVNINGYFRCRMSLDDLIEDMSTYLMGYVRGAETKSGPYYDL